ncbi:pentatricopeptide repeat-containing protein, partial [Tanacetum coccineum]
MVSTSLVHTTSKIATLAKSGLVVGLGCCGSVAVSNALIDMYGKCWSVGSVNGVFEELGFRNDVSWCSLLFVYVNVKIIGRLLKSMMVESCDQDHWTFSALMNACHYNIYHYPQRHFHAFPGDMSLGILIPG